MIYHETEHGVLHCGDCLDILPTLADKSVDLVLTDIPYNETNKKQQSGLRIIHKGLADEFNMDIIELLSKLDIAGNDKCSFIVFCGFGQISSISDYANHSNRNPRLLIYHKNNPSPMNGEYTYLSAIEPAIFYKNSGGTFNEHCKHPVFRYNSGESKIHPTQKPLPLFSELLLIHSNEADLILDPFAGSGTTAIACIRYKRRYILIEKEEKYCEIAARRIETELDQTDLFREES